ncbi:MAG: prenyltransferase/squalene oxidase repeat-containing protein [Candidatus Bathyarchaeia archaeon]|jgi:hypothetical protein
MQTVKASDGDSTPVSRALEYLKTQIDADGSFMSGDLTMTQWTILAIVAAGKDPSDWRGSSGKSTEIWFLNQAEEVYTTGQNSDRPVGPWATYVLAALACGLNPRNLNGYDFVTAIMNQSNAAGVLETDAGYLNYNWWGVMALITTGVPANNSVIQGSIAYIEKCQNLNGGWSYATAGAADPDDTGAALMALSAAGVPSDSPCITKALEYLHSVQDSDGGFKFQGYDTNSASDAWVIMGLMSVGQDPTQWTKTDGGKSVVDHLLSLQFYNGAFYWYGNTMNAPVWMTDYAIIALSNKTFYTCLPSLDTSTPSPTPASSVTTADPDFPVLLIGFALVISVVMILAAVIFARKKVHKTQR